MLIDYPALLKEYKENLNNQLRGFKGGPPPFEDWVPYDDDEQKSIRDLIDLAKADGNEIITVNTSDDIPRSYVSERAIKARERIFDLAIEFGFMSANPKVIDLKGDVLTIIYNSKDSPDFHESLIKIEDRLNAEMKESFDIQVAEIKDMNKRQIKRLDRNYGTS